MLEYLDAEKKALKYLNYRPRSQREIEIYLQGKGFSEEIISKVIDYLSEKRYLNDREFSEMWIRDRLKFKPMGKKMLSLELLKKGIEESIIEASLEKYYDSNIEYELARDLAMKKKEKSFQKDDLKVKRQVYSLLQRRGFSYDTVRQITEELF